ncbi:hypothetical protein GCM10009679_63480 [Saccharothrix algeriensis]|uniref:Uncharacterized protein n=1 Tax=Catellatospora bangladeshensis TaxID=310355 RepID=A0A8J3JRS0_9ACTN|nr:hypothetical protein Cba03nite_71350 [Catellatospora bangladeshensis]
MPKVTLRIAGTASVRIRIPLGSTVRRTVPPSGSVSTVRVTGRLPARPVPAGAAPVFAAGSAGLGAACSAEPAGAGRVSRGAGSLPVAGAEGMGGTVPQVR